jgi:hypothetical protein
VVDAGLFAEYESGEFTAQIAAFGRDVSLFPDLASYNAADMTFAAESFFPVGSITFHEDEENWKPSAHALLSGQIKSVQRCTNAYTGGSYYHLRVDCLGLKLDVLLKTEEIKTPPVVGGYIHGVFYLTARLFVSDQDDCLTPCFAIETDQILERIDSMDFRDEQPQLPLASPIDALNLSVRSHNRLVAAGIQTIGQLVSCSVEELAQVPRLGKRGLAEVLDALAKQGYELRQ